MISTSQQCSSLANRIFGWLVICDAFDSAFMFELSIFTIAASVLFLLIIPFRVRRLLSEDPKAPAVGVYRWKIVSISVKLSIEALLTNSCFCGDRFCAPNCLAHIWREISVTELSNCSLMSECRCCIWPSHTHCSRTYTDGAAIDFDHHLSDLYHCN